MNTRSLYALDSTLAGWPGVGVYTFDSRDAATTPVKGFTPSGNAFNFYEVSVIVGQGSWWLPITPGNAIPSQWLADGFGGVEALVVVPPSPGMWTTAAGQTVMRPAKAFWWIPEETLANNGAYLPAPGNQGSVKGPVPPLQPAPSPSPPVPGTGGGVRFVVGASKQAGARHGR